jgi:hypothetical protein
LGNSSGNLGKGLYKHQHTQLIAVGKEENPVEFQKTLAIHDYYLKGKLPEQNYPLGSVQLTGKNPWQRMNQVFEQNLDDHSFEEMAKRSVDWWITSEDLPDPENKVTLNKDGKIQVIYKTNNTRPHRELIAVWTDHLRNLGFDIFSMKTMDIKTLWHQAGTMAFGENPKKHVLDLNCKLHDLDNAYVVDASFQPTMGAVNPTLTIFSNALRVADKIKQVI